MENASPTHDLKGCDSLVQELLKETQAGKTAKDTRASLDLRKAEPFISGTFEYGVGRPAASRKVYLFINKAQNQQNLHDAMVQFLGVYKTNKKVRPVRESSPGFLRRGSHVSPSDKVPQREWDVQVFGVNPLYCE